MFPGKTEIRHINDRSIASQLRPLHGKLRFSPELAGLPRINATQADSLPAMRFGEAQTMRLAVYGDGAVMITTEADGSKAYRAARVFVRRDGRWLMAASAQTDVKSQ